MKCFCAAILRFSLIWISATTAHAQVGEPLESLPIQDAGRIKPFDTFAREGLQLVYGKRTFEGKPAVDVVFTWMLIPEHWMESPLIEVRHNGLKEALKLEPNARHFSPQAILMNPRLNLILQELQNLRSRQEKLNPYYQAVQRLESQLGLFNAIRTGQALRLVPRADSDTWMSVVELDGDLQGTFARITKGFVESVSSAREGQAPQASAELVRAVEEFKVQARARAPGKYGNETKIALEEHLNHFHPFQWAWIFYLIGFFALIFQAWVPGRALSVTAWIFLLAGWGLHTYGMGLRVYLAGRPPVSNMYETVVWVPWGSVLFGMILALTQKSKVLLGAASAIAVFCLILTDLAPNVLDASIHPLEPVLRSTFWLTTHVLIITISYAAFFLAFGIGDLLLLYYMRDEVRYAQAIAKGAQAIYRSIQIGVVLLAFGIILGGIWADYSWGRFWGWDPKETWALIALLGYLALLHGRLAGWIRNFQLAAGSVVAFSLVIMAWYGVNYVLGAGLHSYGFGAGGVEYVAIFVGVHLLFVTYVSTVRYMRSKK